MSIFHRDRWPDLTYGPITPHPAISLEGLSEMLQPKQTPTTEYSEVEHKYAADHVQVADFTEWVRSNLVGAAHTHVAGTDEYYEQGENVIRYRYPTSGAGELTVKVRKDAKSTTNRVEVDLPLDAKASPADVQRFLHYSGWKPSTTLFKVCDIFHFSDVDQGNVAIISSRTGPSISLVIYDILHIPAEGQVARGRKRFIEVEVEKSAAVSQAKALEVLSRWHLKLSEAFKLSEPLTDSLYEIYTDGRYRVEKQGVPAKSWKVVCDRCHRQDDLYSDPNDGGWYCNVGAGTHTGPCGGRLHEVK